MSNTRLAAALESLEEEERSLAAELLSLHARTQELEARLREVRDAIGPVKKLINGTPKFSLNPPQEQSYDGLPISDAIHKLLTTLHKPMTPPEIARELLARGYTTNSENFTNLVGVTVRRLDGKRFMRDDENRWTYMPH